MSTASSVIYAQTEPTLPYSTASYVTFATVLVAGQIMHLSDPQRAWNRLLIVDPPALPPQPSPSAPPPLPDGAPPLSPQPPMLPPPSPPPMDWWQQRLDLEQDLAAGDRGHVRLALLRLALRRLGGVVQYQGHDWLRRLPCYVPGLCAAALRARAAGLWNKALNGAPACNLTRNACARRPSQLCPFAKRWCGFLRGQPLIGKCRAPGRTGHVSGQSSRTNRRISSGLH